jgi:hypothetical protein
MQPKYCLNPAGEFVIENYNLAKPFANFFPGIAGKYGIPMWVFYVNRAQGIIGVGTRDKDHSIMEFFPANKAWQYVSYKGFRTLIKVKQAQKTLFYEPFHNGFSNLGFSLRNKMSISPWGLGLQETNSTLGLEVKVEYFNIPNDNYAGLARIVSLKNASKKPLNLELLDGLPQIIPYATANLFLKKLNRTIEAWMQVKNLERNVPFYKLDVDPADRPEVIHIQGGNFYLSFQYRGKTPKVIKPIVDPEAIFGPVTDFSYPTRFLEKASYKYPIFQSLSSRTPAAFSLLNLRLKPGEEKTFYTVIGQMRSLQLLNASISKITAFGYLDKKRQENKALIKELQSEIETKSSSREFDLYAQQTYLDNILRGGYPLIIKSRPADAVFYLYSRKHGDLERDYNKFHLQPSYFSQGNGNYRDANQNHRLDVWFNPQIHDENILSFLNLIQADGFNPLVVKGVVFSLQDKDALRAYLKKVTDSKNIPTVISFLEKPFTPGDVVIFLEDHKIKLNCPCDAFLGELLSCSIRSQEAEHGEGFWIDHWHYNLDLLESYLGIYPEKLKELVFEKRCFTFFDNMEVVRPRQDKYILQDGRVRQFHAVVPDHSKREMIRKRTAHPHLVRTNYGNGQPYETTLINKLLCLLANKLASLDPFGMGIEMEANKPNWYDALNGLPGLLGSSLCETFELKRLCLFIKESLLKASPEKILVSEEILDFLQGLAGLLEKNNAYLFWDKSASLKEEYRQKTKLGFSGKEAALSARDLNAILDKALNKLDAGIGKARDSRQELYYSYFINEPAEYETLKDNSIRVKKFRQVKLPLFLEGQMHALRLCNNPAQARSIYQATRKSPLFDRALKMYKVTASLKSMPEEIGRARVFTPGWLEHESIWVHMEYKYLLELLKKGLYAEFYADFKNALIPFQEPARYGRSILEGSSFLVSSAFPDKRLHGNGFVARLSGSTAEFLQMWLMMNAGKKAFFLDKKGELNLCFNPLLAGWLFDKENRYSFKFLGKITVTYHNPKRKNTFGESTVAPKKISFDDKNGKPVVINSGIIPTPYASQIRSRQILRLEIELG